MTREQKQQCKQIFEHYGEENQLDKLLEETEDLIEATMKYQEDKSEANLNHLAEEIADVEIMLRQIKAITGDKVDEFVQYKLNRQLKRIEQEEKDEQRNWKRLF